MTDRLLLGAVILLAAILAAVVAHAAPVDLDPQPTPITTEPTHAPHP